MNMKVGLKIGTIELQFEGSTDLYEAKFESVLTELLALGKARLDMPPEAPPGRAGGQAGPPIPRMTVKAIASKLGGESGGDLLYAAIASLALVKVKETFTRQELLDEMKLAVGYYKPTYSGNLSGYLETASKKGLIIEISKDTYALRDNERAEMERKLAE